jgi:nucleoid DNA-binding protein
MVEVFFKAVKEALRDRRRIEFRGFGSFVVRDYEASLGRNPGTGEVVLVGPREKSVFRPSRLMIDRLNSGRSSSGDVHSRLKLVT